MKRFILLLTILYPFCLFAQDTTYRPFIEDGKVWVSKCDKDLSLEGLPVENPGDKPYSYLILYNYFDGDTIVGGRTCKRWIQKYVGPKSGKFLTYIVPIYEEDKKVWFYFEEGVGPFLMYDFGTKVGDTLIVESPDIQRYQRYINNMGLDAYMQMFTDTLVVYSVGEEFLGNREQTAIHFYSAKKKLRDESMREFSIQYNYHMCGIGSQWYPLWNNCVIKTAQAPWLIYCVVGNEILYEDRERAEFWNIPLPTSITAPRSDTSSENRSSSSSNCADLSGRQLSSPPTRKGVYIRDGRKVLIK